MGHFSAALDLIRDPAPLRRLAERLRRVVAPEKTVSRETSMFLRET
jgi:hypothetical protein